MLKDYSNRWFCTESLTSHMYALGSGTMGGFVSDFLDKNRIPLKEDDDLPEDVYGAYCSRRFRRGYICYDSRVNSLILGHEGRHAWQDVTLPRALKQPDSAPGQVLYDRFIEADARALHLGITLQTVAALRADNYYARNLLECLQKMEGHKYAEDPEEIEDIVLHPAKLAQVMREAFDDFIIHGLATSYDEQSMARISEARTSGLSRLFFVNMMGQGRFTPCFTRKEMDPAYPLALAGHLGNTGDSRLGNYLLDTKGPALNSAFYTRICNVRIEKKVAAVQARLG